MHKFVIRSAFVSNNCSHQLDNSISRLRFTQSEKLSLTDSRIEKFVSNKLAVAVIAGAVRIAVSPQTVGEFAPEVVETFHSKHPSSSLSLYTLLLSACFCYLLRRRQCYEIVRGIIDGVRLGHIRDLVSDWTAETEINILNSLSTLINLFLCGQLSNYPRQLFFGLKLTALPQKNEGIWPIAVENIFRFIASKIACRPAVWT